MSFMKVFTENEGTKTSLFLKYVLEFSPRTETKIQNQILIASAPKKIRLQIVIKKLLTSVIHKRKLEVEKN